MYNIRGLESSLYSSKFGHPTEIGKEFRIQDKNLKNTSGPHRESAKKTPSRRSRAWGWIKNNPGKILTGAGTSLATLFAEGWLYKLYDVASNVIDYRKTVGKAYWPGKGWSLHKKIVDTIVPWGTKGEMKVNPRDYGKVLTEIVNDVDLDIYDAVRGSTAGIPNVYLIGAAVVVGMLALGYGIYRLGKKIEKNRGGK